jgi:hypothetical protein
VLAVPRAGAQLAKLGKNVLLVLVDLLPRLPAMKRSAMRQ